ncbi:Annexin [Gonapodya prolifera JEL478]|uniref:Annexin n=1 Tax=Gonapodya prolifera (strain JEL478) TaxID=1344416 RepID=A0A139A7L0_GONPJ|nr:Annexin [Gonapodya prolifera JEL478]|eukprot:KXS12425.1 Annexin [Gonapodya prolifera JEL478]
MFNRPRAADEGPTYAQNAAGGYSKPAVAPVAEPKKGSALERAITLHNAIVHNDKETIIDIVCRTSPLDIGAIVDAHRKQFGESPGKTIRGNLGGAENGLLEVLNGCAMPDLEFEVFNLRSALMGTNPDEYTVIDALVPLSPDEMSTIKSAYQQIAGKSLEAELHKYGQFFHRDLMTFFDCLLNVERKVATGRKFDINADVDALYAAGQGKIGTDEKGMFRILTERPDAHLLQLFDAYERKYRKTVEDVIKHEFKFHERKTEKAALLLVACIRDRATAIADLFYKSMDVNVAADIRDGDINGVNELRLARLTVRHRDASVRKVIKEAFQRKYGITLSAKISASTKGGLRDALLACMGEGIRLGR